MLTFVLWFSDQSSLALLSSSQRCVEMPFLSPREEKLRFYFPFAMSDQTGTVTWLWVWMAKARKQEKRVGRGTDHGLKEIRLRKNWWENDRVNNGVNARVCKVVIHSTDNADLLITLVYACFGREAPEWSLTPDNTHCMTHVKWTLRTPDIWVVKERLLCFHIAIGNLKVV